jgi:hypothetical protein
MVRSGLVDPARLISHRLPLSDAQQGYEMFDRREAFKVVLTADGVADRPGMAVRSGRQGDRSILTE